jgi:SWIM zinc finger
MDDKRQQKAQLLFNGGVRPTEIRKDTWTVRASSGPLVYEVRRDGGFLSCSCPDFTVRGGECKHILLVRLAVHEPETKQGCEWFMDRSRLIIV